MKKKKQAKKLTLNRETMVNLDNESLAEANGGLSLPCPTIPCMPTAIKTCQTCCHASCS